MNRYFTPFGVLVRRLSKMASEVLNKIADCEIDATGDFKYVLVEVTDKQKNTKTVVRGNIRGFYHADILEEFEGQVAPLKVECECPGGGRIQHKPEEKLLRVYSYSQGFGRANHQIAADILKKKYPEYNIVAEEDDE